MCIFCFMCFCVCVCVRAHVCVCVRVCAHACLRAWMCERENVRVRVKTPEHGESFRFLQQGAPGARKGKVPTKTSFHSL